MSVPKVDSIQTPFAVASDQIEAVMQSFTEPADTFPPPPWKTLSKLTGPLLPGTLTVIGAKSGMGKTSLLLNYFVSLVELGVKTLYVVSADGGARRLRRLIVAMQCGFDKAAVQRNDWDHASNVLSGTEAKEKANQAIYKQLEWADCGMVTDMPTMTRDSLRDALKYGMRHHARVVMVDHINRYSPKMPSHETRELAEVVKALAATASAKQVAVVLAAQVTEHEKTDNPFAKYEVPPDSWLAQTAELKKEPHVILMIGRCLQQGVIRHEAAKMVQSGEREPADYLEHGVMVVEVAKDRDGGQVGKRCRLFLNTKTGHITETAE